MRARADLHHLQGHRAEFVRDKALAALRRLATINDCPDDQLAALVCDAISELRAAESELMWLEVA